MRRSAFLFLFFSGLFALTINAQETLAVVTLKNGTELKGVIKNFDSTETLTMAISGIEATIKMDNVARIESESSAQEFNVSKKGLVYGYCYSNSFYKEAAHTTKITGEEEKIYVDIPTDQSYRWSGSAYILISNPYSVDEEDLTVINNNIKFKDRPNTDGMGRIVLRKNMISGVNTLTQNMMTQTNTIYVIQYDFILGENITIPAGCVLDFQGGSISSGTILFKNTYIISQYPCMFVDIAPASTINNSMIDCSWFGMTNNDPSFDNGAIINKVGSKFRNIFIPYGTWYISTFITLTDIDFFECVGKLYYNGKTETEGSVIKISSDFCRIKINYLGGIKSNISRIGGPGSTPTSTNICGVEIYNSRSNKIQIDFLEGFNTGIKFMGDGRGCCYHIFENSVVNQCNVCIRLTQDNGGWCNENYFKQIRGYYASEKDVYQVLFVIAGPKYENKKNVSDTYDKCNGITIEDCSCEGYKSPKYASVFRNLSQSALHFSRAEATVNLFKIIGFFNNNNYSVKYKGYGNIVELSEASGKVRLQYDDTKKIRYSPDQLILANRTTKAFKINGGKFLVNKNLAETSKLNIYKGLSNFYLDNSNRLGALAYVFNHSGITTLYIKSPVAFRFAVLYLDSNGAVISDVSKYKSPLASNTTFLSNGYGYRTGTNLNEIQITIHESNISKFAVAFYSMNAEDTPIPFIDVFGAYPEDYQYRMSVSATSDRPQTNGYGEIYYDTDLGQTLIHDNSTWRNILTGYREGLNTFGPKSNRPQLNQGGDQAFLYFDVTLNKPIWWDRYKWIDATGAILTWPITYTLSNLAASNIKQPDANVLYSTVLSADEGYKLPATIIVKMGNTILTAGTDYTYNASTGKVIILGLEGSGGVTSEISITAIGTVNP